MKHVLLLRLFLVLFNLSWISWTVFVHAEKSFESTSGESKTSALGLNDTNGELRTTISEPYPPTNHTNTIGVVHHTSDNISESQSSEEVTSKKPVDKEKSVITERSLSSVISNGEGHSSLTTVRQESSGIVIKTNERTGTFGSSNQLSISHGEVTTNAAYSMGELSDSGMNSQQSNHVDVNKESQGKISVTTSATHSTDESSVSRMNSGLNEHVSISKESQAKMSVTTSAAYSTDELSDSLMNSQQSNHISVSKEQLVKTSVTTTSASYFRNESLVSDSGMNSSEQNDHVDRSKEQQSKTSVATNAEYSMFDLGDSGMSSEHSNHINVSDGYHANSSVTTSAAYSIPESSVSGMSSGLNDHVSVSKESDAKISVTTSAAYSTNESSASQMTSEQNNHVSISTEHQAKISDVSTAFVAHTTLLHFQSTTPVTHFPFEDLMAPTNITSVNVTDVSATLRWCQAARMVPNVTVTVTAAKSESNQRNTELRCSGEISNETTVTALEFCNWTWMSYDIPPAQLKAGMTYDSTIRVCISDRCESASHTFQTAPAIPEEIKVIEVGSQSVNISWTQKGAVDNFSISVSDPAAKACWTSDNETPMTVWGFIDRLSTPGQLLTITITALSGQLKSNGNQSFNTKPSKPGSLVVIDCQSTKLCVQWNQLGIFDSYIISVNGSKAMTSCWNSSNTENFLTTVNCTVHHVFPSGSFTTLSVAVQSGLQRSEETTKIYVKEPSKPKGLRVVMANTSTVCFSWNQTGFYEEFDIKIYNSYQQNHTLPKQNVTRLHNDDLLWCINELPCPGAAHSLLVATVSHGKRSGFQNLNFLPVPKRPSNVTVEVKFVDSLQLSVYYNNAECQCTHVLFDVSGKGNITDSCNITSHNITSLKSNMFYNISVYTISNHSQSSLGSRTSVDSTFVSSWTLPEAVSNLNVTSSTVDSLTLQWNQPDDSVIGIREYILSLRNSSDYVKNISLNCSSTSLDCRLKAMTYKLNNLIPNTNYTITIWAINDGGFSREGIITNQTLPRPPEPMSSDFSSLIVGIIVATIVIIILTVFLLVIVLRKKPKFAVPSARRPSNGSGFHNPTFTPDFCESMKPTPIPLDKFIEHLETLHSDTDHLFSSEYALLTELSPKLPQTAAEMEENRIKNRYSNILPFDHSRVKLIPLDDDDQGSDYINANYMPGYGSKREFIAAQGPMKSTVDDFWRMIWEQHVSTIVMVTNLQERGREKCAEYWPTDEEPVFYGDLQVQMKSESQLNYYIIRILDVKLGEKKRVVKHLHFISWPDFGCPENTTQLLDFVLGVRAHAPSQPLQGSGPILVHCSAGVGRTGTFILVDHLLQRMRTHRSLDVFGLVLDMRNYRCNMLQTEAQYVFAHECIKTAIERQMISSVRSSTPEDEEEDMYQNVRKKEEDGESMYQNVSRKDQLEEEEECAYINCTKNNGESVPV